MSERLQKALEHSGLSKSEVARRCGVSPASVTQWLNGDTKEPKADKIFKLAAAAGVSFEWLVTGKGQMLGAARQPDSNLAPAPLLGGMAPLISWIQAGAFAESVVIDLDEETEYYPRPANASDQTFVLRVVGESMIDEYKPGTLIFVDPEKAAKNGDDVVAALEGTGEATFKRYIEDPVAGKMLKAMNSSWPNQFIEINGNCRIVGVVVADMRLR